ncbi:aromatic amino acid transaminase [Sphingosinicella soli]|uniref:Aminotransferase n=1 Tax=Sphingosinicella soli TaxID=333708 RepID=A0A7W7B2R7_9SPHN|nr:amino acid aminotransferase [Sphingosinicella soli]MBB4632951.1 aspartate/tyrosine/aromatic aminotransferase [Sphingosinicella soli]
MFAELDEPPLDPILGLAQLLAGDTSPDKVDLGIGIYHDDQGRAPVLDCVKAAERWLLETQPSKRYLSSSGNADYNAATRALLFGDGSDGFARSRTIQAPGGTGALRLASDLLRRLSPGGRIFIPGPTWPNHPAIFKATGHELVVYPYYDIETGKVRFDEMMATLGAMGAKDTLLLHGCCHNPTGADLDAAQWSAIADLVSKTGAAVMVDLAYLGLGDGLSEDAAGIRLLAERLPEFIVATSCSKNFALYRERVGALTVVGASETNAVRAHAHALPVARTLWSMPPDHGAAIVAHVLGDAELRRGWERELATMRDRINTMRNRLSARLAGHGDRDYGFIARQRGMFTMLGISPEGVETLRREHHVHLTSSGRVNVAGLNEGNVDRVADAIAAVGNAGR